MQTVWPISGEPFRFFVRSRTDKGQSYLVDLQANNLNGFCGCQDFEFRRSPVLRENEGRPSDASRCWHITEARNHMLDELIRRIAATAKRPEEILA